MRRSLTQRSAAPHTPRRRKDTWLRALAAALLAGSFLAPVALTEQPLIGSAEAQTNSGGVEADLSSIFVPGTQRTFSITGRITTSGQLKSFTSSFRHNLTDPQLAFNPAKLFIDGKQIATASGTGANARGQWIISTSTPLSTVTFNNLDSAVTAGQKIEVQYTSGSTGNHTLVQNYFSAVIETAPTSTTPPESPSDPTPPTTTQPTPPTTPTQPAPPTTPTQPAPPTTPTQPTQPTAPTAPPGIATSTGDFVATLPVDRVAYLARVDSEIGNPNGPAFSVNKIELYINGTLIATKEPGADGTVGLLQRGFFFVEGDIKKVFPGDQITIVYKTNAPEGMRVNGPTIQPWYQDTPQRQDLQILPHFIAEGPFQFQQPQFEPEPYSTSTTTHKIKLFDTVTNNAEITRITVTPNPNTTWTWDPQQLQPYVENMPAGVTWTLQPPTKKNGSFAWVPSTPIYINADTGIGIQGAIKATNSNEEITITVTANQPQTTYPQPERDKTWMTPQVPNPPVPQRCGLKVAIVADLTKSIQISDDRSFQKLADAGITALETLRGSTAQLGIYNFNGYANIWSRNQIVNQFPPDHGSTGGLVSMDDPAGVEKARTAINGWRDASSPNRLPGEEDGTNWEAGLKQLEGENYDVVYFITDGVPTTNDTDRANPSTIYTRSKNTYMDASDVNSAIEVANRLKEKGTRIVPIMVDVMIGPPESSHRFESDLVGKELAVVQARPLNDELAGRQYKLVAADPGYYQGQQGVDRLAAYTKQQDTGANRYLQMVYGGDVMAQRMEDGTIRRIEGNPADPKVNSEYSWGLYTVEEIAQTISGPGDYINISNITLLQNQLRSLVDNIATYCGGISVVKRIVDDNGTVLTQRAGGWQFSISAENPIIADATGKRVTYSAKTTPGDGDDIGRVNWSIGQPESAKPAPQTLFFAETLTPGWALYKRGGHDGRQFNAVCRLGSDGEGAELAVTNYGEAGFSVTMPLNADQDALDSVQCTVDNYEVKIPEGEIYIKKASYDAQTGKIIESDELSGAMFALYGVNANGDIDLTNKISEFAGNTNVKVTDTTNGDGADTSTDPDAETNVIPVIRTGSYYLVETQAPPGYSLLAKEIPLTIGYDQAKSSMTVSVNSALVTAAQDTAQKNRWILTIADTKTGTLPKTGGHGVGVWAILGAVITAAGGLALRKRRS